MCWYLSSVQHVAGVIADQAAGEPGEPRVLLRDAQGPGGVCQGERHPAPHTQRSQR